MKKLDVLTKNTCYIGDHPVDMEAANEAGISGIWIDRNEHQYRENIHTNNIIKSLKELLNA